MESWIEPDGASGLRFGFQRAGGVWEYKGKRENGGFTFRWAGYGRDEKDVWRFQNCEA